MGINRKSGLSYPVIFTLFFFGIYLTFALSSFHKPLQADEIFFSRDAELLYLDTTCTIGVIAVCHPPFYLDILRIFKHIFGATRLNLRFINILCFIISSCLIYFIGKQIASDSDNKNSHSIGLIALFLYASHPMAIQGSLILDIDNSILNLLLTLFIFYFLKVYNNLAWRNRLFLGLLLFACLWSKLSTPWVLILSMFLFYSLNGQIKQGIKESFFITTFAIVLFCIMWVGYAHIYNIPLLSLLGRIAHPVKRGLGSLSLSFLSELTKRTIRLFLWLNPYLFFLTLVALITRLKERFKMRATRPMDFCLLYILIIFFGYTLVSGTIWSFPKYHYPLLAILVIVVVEIIYKLNLKIDKGDLILYISIILLFIIYNLAVVGDLLYLFNYKLRNALILNPETLPLLTRNLLWRFFLYLVPLPLTILILRKRYRDYRLSKVAILSLFIVLISGNMALNIIQARATYATNYCYGRDINDMKQLGAFLRSVQNKNPNSLIIGPMDVLYNAGLKLTEYQYHIIGGSTGKFLGAISDRRVICVAYGISWNSIFSYQNVFSNMKVRERLSENYRYIKIGEYSVWLRKDLV